MEHPLEVVDFREPRRNQSQVERELCPHVRHVCQQYNDSADVFSQIFLPYTDDGPTGLGKVIEQKLLNRGMSFADIKGLTIADLVAAKRSHEEHRKQVKHLNPLVGQGPKFGLGYIPGAIEHRRDAEKARQHQKRIVEKSREQAQAKRAEDEKIKDQIRDRDELWETLDDFEKAARIQKAKQSNKFGGLVDAKWDFWKENRDA